ncbi:50S ribosomal protein L4 [Oceanirhabdus sp. W0125-5]|uniref:50S ribosomal protein L4 n=1 Tax=Oceanirhabdus sp. W0125-5 TaxID=2999116 RepID=UPI0022F3458C|nr:50S ribosomal protein L4 [Oceanirhabdus sp. W0125-5]WBW97994.1 50S ribosomal protein L4 [Oceanirhabdus sp. W0125-5]
MPSVAVYDRLAKKVGEIELSDKVFGVEVNKDVMHQVVVAQLANKRQGTQSAKTRSEVRGGGRKPWRQKGTGNARQGSIRAAQWIKGGVVFAPKPRSYRQNVLKKVRRLAITSALSSKVLDNNVIVLDSLSLEAPKTKEMVNTINAFEAKKTLIVVTEGNENVYKSARNIPGVQVIPVNNINVYDILKYENFMITKDAVAKIEEVYA